MRIFSNRDVHAEVQSRGADPGEGPATVKPETSMQRITPSRSGLAKVEPGPI